MNFIAHFFPFSSPMCNGQQISGSTGTVGERKRGGHRATTSIIQERRRRIGSKKKHQLLCNGFSVQADDQGH